MPSVPWAGSEDPQLQEGLMGQTEITPRALERLARSLARILERRHPGTRWLPAREDAKT